MTVEEFVFSRKDGSTFTVGGWPATLSNERIVKCINEEVEV